MLNEIVRHLNISRLISQDQATLLEPHLNTLQAWQTFNYLSFVSQHEPIIHERENRQFYYDSLLEDYSAEIERIIALNRAGMSVTDSQLLMNLRKERNRMRWEEVQQQSEVVQRAGLWSIARQHTVATLTLITEGKITRQSWHDIRQHLEQTPLFSIHPLVQAELERIMGEDPGFDEETELRQLLWSEALGIPLPFQKEALESALVRYQRPLDLLMQFDPEVSQYLDELGVEGDDRYLQLLEILPLLQIGALHAFAQHCLTQVDGFENWETFLQLAVHQSGLPNPTTEKIATMAHHLSETPLTEILQKAQGQTINFTYLFTEYYWQLEPQQPAQPESEEALFNSGRLPNFKSEAYRQLLPHLLKWAETSVNKRAADRNISLPNNKDAYLANSVVDNILNGLKAYESFFGQILTPRLAGRENWEWSIGDIRIMAIVMAFENKRWGGGGIKDANKARFTADLKELSERS